MESLPVDTGGIFIMSSKGEFFIIKTSELSSPAANILKQQMLSIGGECATSKYVIKAQDISAPAILMGTRAQFLRLIDKLENQPFGLSILREELIKYFDKENRSRYLRIGNRVFDLSKRTYIMGVLNLTPDSFYDGGKFSSSDEAVEEGLRMVEYGADILDVGGESTRPGSEPVDIETELSRVIPVIEGLKSSCDIPISIDTYKSKVAEEAISRGASIVNDISGLRFDPAMPEVVSRNKVSIVLMHIKGKPKDMQVNPTYNNLIDEIMSYLSESIEIAMDSGIERDRIIIDPGIGFGKIWSDNFKILRYLSEFKSLGFPILVGPSRKSFIGNLLNLPVNERLEGTLSAVSCAIMNGADIVRVHDVKEAIRAARVADAIVGKG